MAKKTKAIPNRYGIALLFSGAEGRIAKKTRKYRYFNALAVQNNANLSKT